MGSLTEDQVKEAYRRYFPIIVRKSGRMLRDASEAQDLAQETFLRLWRSRLDLRDAAATIAWLYQTCTRLALDRLRSRVRPAEGSAELADGLASPEASAEDRSHHRALLKEMIDRFPATEIEAAILVRDTAVVAATPQHPSFRIDLSGRRDLALVSLTNAKTTLSLKQTSGPLQLVHLDTGLLILESPRGPRELRLSVRPGRYLIRRHLASETRVKEIDLRPDAATTVREAELVAVSSGPLAAKSAAERDVSASIVAARAIELQAAGGVRHAPVIDPGLRLGEGGPGAVGILRASYGIGGGWQFMAPLAFGYGGGDRFGWDWVTWAGMPTLGLGRTDAAGTIVSGLAGAGFDLRRWLGAQATFNASAAVLGAYSWTSRAPDPTAGASPGRHALDTWSAQLTGGFTRFISDAVSLNLGVSINHNLVAAGDLAPWARDDARGGLVLGVGSIQRRGLRPLPLVRVYLGDRLTLDGHVAVAYLPATKSVVETYLAGVTAMF